MIFIKTKYEKQLDGIIQSMEMNMANNYKDNAQANLREFEEMLSMMKTKGLLKDKVIKKYENILSEAKEKMKGYSHREQTPYWT